MRRITDHPRVLRLDSAAMAKPTPTQIVKGSLHICPVCGSALVQPTCWEQGADRSHWRVWRRCPECEWASDSVHGEHEIDAFDEQLDLGAQELANELRSLQHANMSEMVDAFITALANDLITADDFA